MPEGTVKKLISQRGFGFILPEGADGTDQELFFHATDVQGGGYEALREGQRIAYDLGRDERRNTPKATNVRSL
jgi:cold shock protein